MEFRNLGCHDKKSIRLPVFCFTMNAAQEHAATLASGSDRQKQAQGNMQSRPDIVEPTSALRLPSSGFSPPTLKVALLTGGGDKPYVLGLAEALTAMGLLLDLIGSDDLDAPELRGNPRINFLNLRGDQSVKAGLTRKVFRVLAYYFRLFGYALTAKPKIFHILWNNKFEMFDRTILMLYYRLLGKKVVLTAHNVNVGKRDSTDSLLNRVTLKFQYRLADHIFVHTKEMKGELIADFKVSQDKISVIPFGINNTVSNSSLTSLEAKRQLGIGNDDKVMLFFGNIAPYKGLEHLIAALAALKQSGTDYRLIIAGRVKTFITAGKIKANCDQYWDDIQTAIGRNGLNEQIIRRIEFIPDAETELYFKAADVLVLPYTRIFQSGVLFLGYSFGLPVIAADVGSLKEDIIAGKTGSVFRAEDPPALARAIETYFSSDLFRHLENRRQEIRNYANERYSWSKVGEITRRVYHDLLAIT